MRLLFIFTSWSLFFGCDAAKDIADRIDDVDAGTGKIEIEVSVDGDTMVGELMEEQRNEINRDVNLAVLAAVTADDYCNQSALTAAASDMEDPAGACASVQSDCQDAIQLARTLGEDPKQRIEAVFVGAVPEEYRLGMSTLVFKGDVSDCNSLTVTKLEACLTDLAQGMIDAVRQVSCDSLSVEAALSTLGAIAGDAVPTSGPCIDVDIAMCPGLFAEN